MKFVTIFTLFFVCLSLSAFSGEKIKNKSKSKANPNAAVYDVASTLEEHACGAGSCWIILEKVNCSWSNGEKPGNFKCSYLNEAGDKKNVPAQKAAAFAGALEEASEIQKSCDEKTCKFSRPQTVSCRGPNDARRKVTCTISGEEEPKTGSSSKGSGATGSSGSR